MKGDTDDTKYTSDEKFLLTASGSVGCHVIDISDITQPKLLFTWNFNNSGTLENVVISSDDKYVFLACRSYGCIILNFEDKTKAPYKIAEMRGPGILFFCVTFL